MTHITQEKIQEITDTIVEKFDPEKIVLFGSFAWGTPDIDSDVDLFVVKKTQDARKESRNTRGSIFPSEFPMDIIVYDPDRLEKILLVGDMFLSDVIHNGKVLYER